MMIRVSESNGPLRLEPERQAEINDHTGPASVVKVCFPVELSIGYIETAAFLFIFSVGFRIWPPTGRGHRLRLGRGRTCRHRHRAVRLLVNEDFYLDGARIRRALWGVPAPNPSRNISEVCAVELVRDVDGGLLTVHNRFDGEAKQ